MKNLSFEDNVRQIYRNQTNESQRSMEVQMGQDIFLDGNQLITLFDSVKDRVVNNQDGLRIGLHLYGLPHPFGFASSDFGDHEQSITVDDIPFNTIEGMRDFLVDKLLTNNEVYVYTINTAKCKISKIL